MRRRAAHRLLAPALVVAALGILAAGCGEGDGAEGESAEPLTRSEFVRQANAICRQERADVDQEVEAFLDLPVSTGKPQPVLRADLAHSVLLPTLEVEIARIYTLDWPTADEKQIDAMLSAERLAIDNVAVQERLASAAQRDRYFDESAELMREYGLRACAGLPAA